MVLVGIKDYGINTFGFHERVQSNPKKTHTQVPMNWGLRYNYHIISYIIIMTLQYHISSNYGGFRKNIIHFKMEFSMKKLPSSYWSTPIDGGPPYTAVPGLDQA